MSNKALSKRLKEIQKTADESDKQYESSRQLLFNALSSAFLWWLDARDEPKLLNDLYKKNDIKPENVKDNRPKFKPLVRLIFKSKKEQSQRAKQWADCIGALYGFYCEKQYLFTDADSAQNLLVNYINDEGGVIKLHKKFIGKNADDAPVKQKLAETSFDKKTAQERIKNDKQLLEHKRQVLLHGETSA